MIFEEEQEHYLSLCKDDQWLRQNYRKWVVINGKSELGVWETEREAYGAGRRAYGSVEPFFLRQVGIGPGMKHPDPKPQPEKRRKGGKKRRAKM